MLPHDVRIGPNVGRAGGVFRQAAQIGQAAGFRKGVMALQFFRESDDVERLTFLRERHHRPEYQTVFAPVEILLSNPVGNLVPRLIIEHQPPQHRLFGLYGMGWHPQGIDIRQSGFSFCWYDRFLHYG